MKALISVTDKTGVVELAHELTQAGFEIISTGGTAKALRQAEVTTTEVSDLTKFPEILSGRVKTLHPKIFGGILYRRDDPKHKTDVETQEIPPIDWVVVNLYPFERISMENKVSREEMIEFIDIGGVSLLRAAAKNYADVVVLSDQADYARALSELKENGKVSLATRRMLAGKAFAHTAHYDSMIAKFFRESYDKATVSGAPAQVPVGEKGPELLFPNELTLGLRKVTDLRYGENPQQKAALYRESGKPAWGVVDAEKLQGKELSFNNYLDLENAWQIANSFALGQAGSGGLDSGANGVCCTIIKHTNPCGTAIGKDALEAFGLAYTGDPLSAFGGIIGLSSTLDKETAAEISKTFFECIIAPDYTPEALEILKKKPNLRLLRQKTLLSLPFEFDVKKVSGGLLIQERDLESGNGKKGEDLKAVSKRTPTAEEILGLAFAAKVCKFVKSNAIVLARGQLTYGVGAGQMSRIVSLKIASQKMKEMQPPAKFAKFPLVMASDAFFPFRDCVDEAAKIGVTAIVQPGGSIRDQESIDAANEHNLALVFTGVRHFRH